MNSDGKRVQLLKRHSNMSHPFCKTCKLENYPKVFMYSVYKEYDQCKHGSR